jgi:DNA mismatch repair protein MutS
MKKTSISNEHFKSFQAIRNKYPGAVVLLKIAGDYTAFGDHAEIIHRLTGHPLTNLPGIGTTCSFPFAETDSILHKLVKAGHKVALCEPLEKL